MPGGWQNNQHACWRKCQRCALRLECHPAIGAVGDKRSAGPSPELVLRVFELGADVPPTAWSAKKFEGLLMIAAGERKSGARVHGAQHGPQPTSTASGSGGGNGPSSSGGPGASGAQGPQGPGGNGGGRHPGEDRKRETPGDTDEAGDIDPEAWARGRGPEDGHRGNQPMNRTVAASSTEVQSETFSQDGDGTHTFDALFETASETSSISDADSASPAAVWEIVTSNPTSPRPTSPPRTSPEKLAGSSSDAFQNKPLKTAATEKDSIENHLNNIKMKSKLRAAETEANAPKARSAGK